MKRANDTAVMLTCSSTRSYATSQVCVRVVGAQDKWVEILASSKEGSSGGSFCVRNRFTGANVEEGEKGCTVQGDLIDIRESGNRPQVNNNNADQMEIVFYAQVLFVLIPPFLYPFSHPHRILRMLQYWSTHILHPLLSTEPPRTTWTMPPSIFTGALQPATFAPQTERHPVSRRMLRTGR